LIAAILPGAEEVAAGAIGAAAEEASLSPRYPLQNDHSGA
tara:strand:+ start:30809 stop:30928 length:120 start_codon:yes stop_codon:yes gene_type:complete